MREKLNGTEFSEIRSERREKKSTSENFVIHLISHWNTQTLTELCQPELHLSNRMGNAALGTDLRTRPVDRA